MIQLMDLSDIALWCSAYCSLPAIVKASDRIVAMGQKETHAPQQTTARNALHSSQSNSRLEALQSWRTSRISAR